MVKRDPNNGISFMDAPNFEKCYFQDKHSKHTPEGGPETPTLLCRIPVVGLVLGTPGFVVSCLGPGKIMPGSCCSLSFPGWSLSFIPDEVTEDDDATEATFDEEEVEGLTRFAAARDC